MSKNKNSQDIDLSKYNDPGGLSLGKLNFGLWLSEKRPKIIKLFVFFLIALSAFFFIYSSYSYVVYFLDTPSTEEQAVINNNSVVSPKNIVSDLIFSSPQVFESGDAYDFSALVKNPNDKFVAYFDYCFVINESDNRCSQGFVLPGEEKYLRMLGQKSTSTSLTATLNFKDLSWQRIDAHEIPEWSSFLVSRLNFYVEGINLVMADKDSGNGFDSLSFSITNKTPYSYYEIPLSINFYKDQELVGVNRYILKDFLAGDKKNVRLSWPSALSGVTNTEIRPDVNLLDENIYLKYQGIK